MNEEPDENPGLNIVFLLFLLALTALAGWGAIEFITWIDRVTGVNVVVR